MDNNMKFTVKTIPSLLPGRSRLATDLRGLFKRTMWRAWGMLIVSLLITVFSTLYIKANVQASEQREFDLICKEIQLNIANRLTASAQLLYSGAGFYDRSENVSRAEWRRFIEHLQVEKVLPGIQGVGFALLIPPDQLDQHIQSIRSEGFPDYAVNPAGQRDIYSSIIYLEPFTGRNLRAFGYDMLSEPVRRTAMEQARDENSAVLSGKVTLVQEISPDVQAGALLYVPVYRHGMPIDTVEQRRAAVMGWVYSPYRMTDMMSGTLGSWNVDSVARQISLQIYDGAALSTESLLYDSQGNGDKTLASTVLLTRLTPVELAGRHWTLRFSWLGGLAALAEYGSVVLVLFSGTSISLLLFGLIISLLNTRVSAMRIADQLSIELRDSNQQLEGFIDGARVGTWKWNVQTGETTFNEGWSQMVGYTLDDLAPVSFKTWATLTHPDDLQKTNDLLQRYFAGELSYYDCEIRMQHKDGGWVWVHARGRVITRTPDGQPLMMFGTHTDISERKQAEELLRKSERKYHSIIAQSAEGILLVDEDGKIQEWNKALQDLTLLPWEAVANRPIWDVLVDLSPSLSGRRVSRDDIMDHIKKSILDNDNAVTRAGNREFDIQRSDGQHRVVNIVFFNIVTDDSRMTAAIYQDVTESRRQESALENAYENTLGGWARAIDMRDETTGDHSNRVMEMTTRLATAMGIPQKDIVHMQRGALLHDIGKIGVPDRILGKPGPLNDEEWVIMKRHPQYAVDMLQPIEYLHPAMEIPFGHHERWNGSGYPRGLKGEEIPIGARIFAVVDIWDALRHNRPYREAMPMPQICSYLESQAGVLLDPRIVETFLALISGEAGDCNQ